MLYTFPEDAQSVNQLLQDNAVKHNYFYFKNNICF